MKLNLKIERFLGWHTPHDSAKISEASLCSLCLNSLQKQGPGNSSRLLYDLCLEISNRPTIINYFCCTCHWVSSLHLFLNVSPSPRLASNSLWSPTGKLQLSQLVSFFSLSSSSSLFIPSSFLPHAWVSSHVQTVCHQQMFSCSYCRYCQCR